MSCGVGCAADTRRCCSASGYSTGPGRPRSAGPLRLGQQPAAIDALFLEWRWPVPGRSTTKMRQPRSHLRPPPPRRARRTLHGRAQYPDGHLGQGPEIRTRIAIAVATWRRRLRGTALKPSPGADSLLFPVADTALDLADRVSLAAMPRPLPLAYAGNQYDRDEAFSRFFAPAATRCRHRVAGKWTRTASWPHVNFTGRCTFPEVRELHESALATVLLLPGRYARAGQMTQRLFEAVLAGCLPITPGTLPFASAFTPPTLHAATGDQVADRISELLGIAGTARHAALIADCLGKLDIFRLSHQLATIDHILGRLADGRSACPSARPTPAR
jgi:hypothetical protein